MIRHRCMVRRDEILFTDEELGRGGWAVKVAKFRAIHVADKCLMSRWCPTIMSFGSFVKFSPS